MNIESNLAYKVIIAIAAIFVIIFGINYASEFVSTIILALFFAVVFFPLIRFFSKLGIPSFISVFIVFGFVFYLLSILASLLLNSVLSFSQQLPQYRDQFITLMNGVQETILTKFNINLLNKFIEMIRDPDVIRFLTSSVSSLSGVITGLLNSGLTITLLLIFLLLDASGFERRANSAIQARNFSYANRVVVLVKSYMIKKFYLSLATGVATYIALSFFDIPFPILWATIVFVFNFIPNIGSIIATIPIILIIIITKFNIEAILIQSAVIIAIQFIIGNFIEPKIFSNSLDISASIVLIGLVASGYLLGTVGLFLTLPILITIKTLMEALPEYRKMAYMISDSSITYQEYIGKLEQIDKMFDVKSQNDN